MIDVENVNNTALYGFHPDFVKEENAPEKSEEKNLMRFYRHDALVGMLLTLVILFCAGLIVYSIF